MEVIISKDAAVDIASIFSWIAKDNPRAAAAVLRGIYKRIARLTMFAYIGHRGLDERTRELVEGPYIIVYIVHEKRPSAEIIAVFHSAQHR